ncbi:MAG TPA: hypothetical protein PLU83_12375, partial [Phycicoccus sp.]|nr:hypothetical protein [Phycicoccus sp.]
SRSVTRRTIAKGVAWTAPAIVFAPAARAYTTSAPEVDLTGRALKLQGNKCGNQGYYQQGYRYYVTATNGPVKDACLEIVSVTVGDNTALGADVTIWTTSNTKSGGCCTLGANSILVPADSSVDFALDANMESSGNTAITVIYNIRNASGACENDFPNATDSGAYETPEIHDCTPYCGTPPTPCPQK